MSEISTVVGGPSLPQKRNVVTSIPGPRSLELTARKNSSVPDGIGVGLPVYIAAGGGGIIRDVDGNSLIDFASGIAVTGVGISNPKVVEAVKAQVELFTHTCFTSVPYESYVEVAEKINEIMPLPYEKRTALFSTGAEAVENAVKIARSYTGKNAIVVFDHAFHGRTNLTMALTAKAHPYKTSFGPFAPDIYRVSGSYPYRDEVADGVQAVKKTISQISKQIGAAEVAAIIIEPLQGEGGFIEPAEGYLPTLYAWAKENDVIFVADEIQSGWARTGDLFAFQHEGITPDLVTSAKAIAGGLPLSSVTGRADIMNAAQPGGLGGTYAGNPLATAAALATIDFIVEEDLAAKAQHIGEVFLSRLTALQSEDERIGDVRGRGAMIAIELVKPGSNEPDPELTGRVASFAHQQGVVVLTAGTYGNVIRFLPPLVIGDELINDGLDVLTAALKQA